MLKPVGRCLELLISSTLDLENSSRSSRSVGAAWRRSLLSLTVHMVARRNHYLHGNPGSRSPLFNNDGSVEARQSVALCAQKTAKLVISDKQYSQKVLLTT